MEDKEKPVSKENNANAQCGAAQHNDSVSRDERFMLAALEELRNCPACEVPVAAVVVCGDEVIATGCNRRETDCDPTAHAEIVAIRNVAKKLGRWNLSDCELYVTLEPCVMCAGSIVYSRVRRVVFGASDLRFGACGSVLDLANNEKLNHRAQVVGGVLESRCLAPIREFFKARRTSKRDADCSED